MAPTWALVSAHGEKIPNSLLDPRWSHADDGHFSFPELLSNPEGLFHGIFIVGIGNVLQPLFHDTPTLSIDLYE